ncbi:hypothetical protein [Kitasatospora sp. NPDC101183]|uniref:hypothetical protein n=1 Tax=Kitasatospora sp. NPDC101183 TaxID=3364100 RepID=UPI003807583B
MSPMQVAAGQDPRTWGIVLDFEDMEGVVGDLVPPRQAPMPVMSALDTARELLRHSFHRYEFGTVAVVHSLHALDQVLAGNPAPPQALPVELPVELPAELAAELGRARALREDVASGKDTSAAITPTRAVLMVRAVFEAVALLLPPPADPPEGSVTGHWEAHLDARFPPGFVGTEIEGEDLLMLDSGVSSLVHAELNRGLDEIDIGRLWTCITTLDRVVPAIQETYCASYFARLRTLAGLVAARYVPEAT